jgi:uncharacterized protein (DUF433 family)
MTALQKAEALLPQMSFAEKAQLVQKVADSFSNEFPGIEKTSGVCGGVACVIRTRIPVRTIVSFKKMGLSDQTMLNNYPSLRHQDLSNAWAYYLAYQDEIDLEIQENEAA